MTIIGHAPKSIAAGSAQGATRVAPAARVAALRGCWLPAFRPCLLPVLLALLLGTAAAFAADQATTAADQAATAADQATTAAEQATTAPGQARSPSGREPSLLEAERIVFQRALERVTPSLVRIDTIGGADPVRGGDEGSSGPAFRAADGPTSGVIWTSDGYILTSSINFVHEPSVITVRLADGRRFIGHLVARDYPSRLALVKIDAEDLPAATLADRAARRPGQWALAAGYGHGSATPTMSIGIISAVNRMDARAVQTDAKISPANYGGPLFDVEGRVIGICVPLATSEDELAGVEWYDSGIGFAIHADFAQQRFERLARGEDLHRGLMGVFFETTEPLAGGAPESAPAANRAAEPAGAGPGSADSPGLRITEPPVGPAAEAGLLQGDVVVAVNGRPTPNVVAFRRATAANAVGDRITVEYVRDGARRTAEVRLASRSELLQAASRPASAPASRPASSEPSDTQPSTRPADSQPADSRSADAQPADSQPADSQPASPASQPVD